MFGKSLNITQQTVNDTVWHWFTLPLFAGLRCALLTLVVTDYIKYFIFSFSLCKYGFRAVKYTNAYIVHAFLLDPYVTSSFDAVKFSNT